MAILSAKDRTFHSVDDICTHLGDDYAQYLGSIVPPIFQNSLFVKPTPYNGVPDTGYAYTRVSNPTIEIAEKKIAALEGAEGALCFSSGMAAISSAIMHFVRKDSHVVYVASSYGPTRSFITGYLANRIGLTYTAVRGSDVEDIEQAIQPNTALIYLESPSSSVFRMQDLAAVAKIAKAHQIGTVIDNTYATPLHQHPLQYGIDISCHTASKYMGGHSDIVAGALAANAEIIESIQHNERELYGSNMDPHQAWLLIRGLRTLPVRLAQHGKSGLKVAQFLEQHPKVKQVFYPGSASYEQQDLFNQYLSGTNGLISIVPHGSTEQIQEFIYSCKLFQYGVSWGGFESLIHGNTVGLSEEQAAKVDCPANLVRIHVGLEDVDSLIADLDQALAKIEM